MSATGAREKPLKKRATARWGQGRGVDQSSRLLLAQKCRSGGCGYTKLARLDTPSRLPDRPKELVLSRLFFSLSSIRIPVFFLSMPTESSLIVSRDPRKTCSRSVERPVTPREEKGLFAHLCPSRRQETVACCLDSLQTVSILERGPRLSDLHRSNVGGLFLLARL